jgi:putative flippase GtrA
MPAASSSVRADGDPATGWLPKILRYTGGSVVATVCSEVTFVLLYGVLGLATTPSSLVGWLAGAVPNYWLNRSWAWQRTGRPRFRDEVLPYVVIIGVTLVLATGVTRWVDGALSGSDVSSTVRVILVAGAFFGVYVVMFVLRFFLLDRLFARLAERDHQHQPPSEGPR